MKERKTAHTNTHTKEPTKNVTPKMMRKKV